MSISLHACIMAMLQADHGGNLNELCQLAEPQLLTCEKQLKITSPKHCNKMFISFLACARYSSTETPFISLYTFLPSGMPSESSTVISKMMMLKNRRVMELS